MRTLRAIIDERGVVTLLEPVNLSSERQALVTILEEDTPPKKLLLLALNELAAAPLSPHSLEEFEADIQDDGLFERLRGVSTVNMSTDEIMMLTRDDNDT